MIFPNLDLIALIFTYLFTYHLIIHYFPFNTKYNMMKKKYHFQPSFFKINIECIECHICTKMGNEKFITTHNEKGL